MRVSVDLGELIDLAAARALWRLLFSAPATDLDADDDTDETSLEDDSA